MMERYAITGMLEAPLALKQSRQSDRSESLSHVPGTTLRGALATSYLQNYGTADDGFRRLFLDESQCRFGPLDPAPAIYPLTAVACKRRPDKHPKSDQLVYRITQHCLGGRATESVHARFRSCGVGGCGADLKAYAGFRGDAQSTTTGYVGSLRSHVSAHVGIDRTTATAADGVFYTLESLAPDNHRSGPQLHGWIEATDEAKSRLEELLEMEDGAVYLGHHRTRGYGRVKIKIESGRNEDRECDPERWKGWSDTLIDYISTEMVRAPGASLSFDKDTDFVFSLTFPTGAVFVDRFLRTTLDPAGHVDWLPPLPDPSALFPLEQRPHTRLGNGALRCLCAITRHQLLRGWNSAHGLPKQDEWSVARGAVYAYWYRGGSDGREELMQRVSELLRDGAGLRRNEGFGKTIVSDPFHLQPIGRA